MAQSFWESAIVWAGAVALLAAALLFVGARLLAARSRRPKAGDFNSPRRRRERVTPSRASSLRDRPGALVDVVGGQRLGIMVESLHDGRCVVYLPDPPRGRRGVVHIARSDHVELLSLTEREVLEFIAEHGAGLADYVRTESEVPFARTLLPAESEPPSIRRPSRQAHAPTPSTPPLAGSFTQTAHHAPDEDELRDDDEDAYDDERDDALRENGSRPARH